jgi:hypothetical protein
VKDKNWPLATLPYSGALWLIMSPKYFDWRPLIFGTNASKKGDIVRTLGPDGAVQATVALCGALWARTVYSGLEYSTVVLYKVDLV